MSSISRKKTSLKKKYNRKVNLKIPSWAALIFALLSVCLVPWTIYLSFSLPKHDLVRHWDLIWVGLDIGIMILLLLTGFFAAIKSKLIIMSATMMSSFLLVDAWFDIQSSNPGGDLLQSVLLAILIEIPLSIIGFSLAYRTIRQITD